MKRILFLTAALIGLAACFLQAQGDGNNKILWTQNFVGMVFDCAFMPDEDYIIDAHDTLLEVRRTADQSLVRSKSFGTIIYSFDLSKDGKYVAIGGGMLFKLLDLNTFEVIKDYPSLNKEYTFSLARSISLSPDGKKIAFAGRGDSSAFSPVKAYVLDVETGKVLFEFGSDDFYQNIEYVLFSPDGKWLACDYSGGVDKKIYVFETENFTQHSAFNGDDNTPYGAAGYRFIYSPNSQFLLATGAAGRIFRVWEISTKNEIIPKGKIPVGSPLVLFNDNETVFIRNYDDNISYFYNIINENYKTLSFAPPIANACLNSNEIMLLGDRLGLVQIDKSILSVDNKVTKNGEDIIIPNPASNIVLLIVILPYNEELEIKLFDLKGNTIGKLKKIMAHSGQFEFSYDIAGIAVGTYYIKITQRDFSKTFKFVKEG
ncbi:MAG: type sorting protein [Bacteroidota bacterium]|nr:type sorting protein [Bacteroidota bacterium]